jgi:transcriptional regulator with XRE-family HTH domain
LGRKCQENYESQEVTIKDLNARIEGFGLNLSRNGIGKILRGEVSPKLETLSLIARALEVDLSDFFQKDVTIPNELNGFVEFDAKIYRIESAEDLMSLYVKVWEKSSRTFIPEPIEPF